MPFIFLGNSGNGENDRHFLVRELQVAQLPVILLHLIIVRPRSLPSFCDT